MSYSALQNNDICLSYQKVKKFLNSVTIEFEPTKKLRKWSNENVVYIIYIFFRKSFRFYDAFFNTN